MSTITSCQTHAKLKERFFLRHFVAFKQEISRAMVEMYLPIYVNDFNLKVALHLLFLSN